MTAKQRPARIVPCPTCGTPLEWSTANRFRPFCSERCKMIDLGAWASETYRVPDSVAGEAANPSEDTAGGEKKRR